MMSAALLALSASAETVNVAWPAEAVDATGSEPIALNDGLFQVVGNNSKVTLTANGFYTGGNSSANARHIMVFPGYDGTLTVEATASADNTDRYVFVSTEDAGADETAADVIGSVAIPEKGVRHNFTVPVSANGVYFVCLHGNGTITNLTYTYGEETAVETFDINVTNGKDETAIAGGETVEKLSWYFYATVPAGVQANHEVEAVLTKDGEPFSTARAGMVDETTAYWTFRNAAPDYIQEAGVYTLTIPAGALYTGEADAHVTENAAVELTWTVTGVAEAHAISILSVKNAGNEAGVVDYVTSTFEVELAEPVSTIGENQAGAMLINNTTHEVYAVSDIITAGTTAYIRFNIGETSALNAAGEYELQLPEKVVVDEAGNYNEACMGLIWTVEAKEVSPFAINEVYNGVDVPAGEVTSLSYQFAITTANVVATVGEGYIALCDAEGNELGGHGNLLVTEDNTIYVRFNYGTEDGLLHTPGVYTLNIPAGALVDAEGNVNEAYTGSWTVIEQEAVVINITEVETGIKVDDTFGFNDQKFTVTMHFTAPEGAKYIYSEGLMLSKDGEPSNVPFTFGMYGFDELESTDVTLVYVDPMYCATDDPDYDGDLRAYGPYVAETEIYFMDENYMELATIAKYVGTVVFENPNKVELGEAIFNVDNDPFYGEIDVLDLEANGLLVSFPEAQNVNPEMIIKVVASLGTVPPAYGVPGEDDIDPGFGMPEFQEVLGDVEFYGSAEFGQAVVNLAEFTQYISEAGAGLFMVTLKSVEVIDQTGVVYSWTANDDEPVVGTVFAVTEQEPNDDPVGINGIAAEQNGAVMFNLQGQRVNAAQGMVIVGGKKALVK